MTTSGGHDSRKQLEAAARYAVKKGFRKQSRSAQTQGAVAAITRIAELADLMAETIGH
jgi:hypothetical protein